MNANEFANKTALVTGANSGLGYEAAAQLAEAGYGRVILACRTLVKAETAKQSLARRVGSDPFATLEVDVSSIASAQAASEELITRGVPIDALLLNAGMVAGDDMHKSVDGLEMSFASSIIGHHVLTMRLLAAGLLPDSARVVIAGSETARNDMPAMSGFTFYDFALEAPVDFGSTLHEAMTGFARVNRPDLYTGESYYAVTKVMTSWWSAAAARKLGDRLSVYTVSPGSNLSTNAARHSTGIRRFLFTKLMPLIGAPLGMDQPVSEGAKRYLDVLHAHDGEYENGKSYMSKPGRVVGPIEEMRQPHLLDVERQNAAWDVICELTGVGADMPQR